MQKGRLLLLLFLLMMGIKSPCQNIICYNLYNNTESDIISWINLGNDYAQTPDCLIREHFYKRIYDFNLVDVFRHIEGYSYDGSLHTLLVLIPSKSNFKYFVNTDSFSAKNFVVTYSRQDVESFLGFNLEQGWLYNQDNIYINGQDACEPYNFNNQYNAILSVVVNELTK